MRESDACERLREELALALERARESEERLRAVLGQSLDVIYRRNLKTDRYDYLSPAAARLTGYTADEMARMSSADLMQQVHPDDREGAATHLKQYERCRDDVFEGGLFEYRLRCKDGGYRWLSDSGRVVFGPEGEPLFHVGVARDVTAQKKAEADLIASLRDAEETTARLRDSEEKLRFLGDNLPGVLLYQLDTGVDGRDWRFTYLSRGVAQIHERSVDEAMATPSGIYAQMAEEDSRRFAELERAAIDTMSMFRAEARINLPSGKTKWVLIASAPRRTADNHLVWDGFEVDITERKRLEEELRLYGERLERVVAERTARLRRLASELAQAEQRERRRLSDFLHDDLQQILAAAKFSAESLVSDLPEDAAAQARKLLGHVTDALVSVRAFSNEMATPLLYVVGLAPALRELAEQMRARYGLRVTFEVGDLPDIADEAVKAQLFHAVRELLFNAAKHSGADTARLLGGYSDGWVELTVSDAGKGFDSGAVLSGAAPACGYGLFSVGERVGDLGGELRVESSPGQGARVTVAIPVAAGPAPAPQAVRRREAPGGGLAPAAAEAGGRARVLIADDHDLVRAGVANLLAQDRRLEVVGEAKNGRDAVALARQVRPDVIVMDIRMPEMDGIEATRLILSERPDVVVVGISAFGDDGFKSAMLEAGAADLLDKADAGTRLTSRIAECLKHRRASGAVARP